jgi:hypothetical protein
LNAKAIRYWAVDVASVVEAESVVEVSGAGAVEVAVSAAAVAAWMMTVRVGVNVRHINVIFPG